MLEVYEELEPFPKQEDLELLPRREMRLYWNLEFPQREMLFPKRQMLELFLRRGTLWSGLLGNQMMTLLAKQEKLELFAKEKTFGWYASLELRIFSMREFAKAYDLCRCLMAIKMLEFFARHRGMR